MPAALYIDSDDHLDGLVRWSAWIAARLGHGLEIVCCENDGDSTRRRKVSPDKEEFDSELAQRIAETVRTLENQDVSIIRLTAPKIATAVIEDITEQQYSHIFVRLPIDLSEPKQAGSLARSLYRSAPADLILVRPRRNAPADGLNILMPLFEGAGADTLTLIARSVEPDAKTTVDVLLDPERSNRSRRTYQKLLDRIKRPEQFKSHAHAHRKFSDQLKPLMEHADVVCVESTEKLFHTKERRVLRQTIADLGDEAPTTILYRPLGAAQSGHTQRWLERVRESLPGLERDERVDLYERIEAGGKVSADFLIMMVLSSGIAAFGLLQNAGAVVIGAMVVAPLMTPLVAIGLALVQSNAHLFRKSLAAMLLGLGLGLATSMVIGLVTPHIDLTPEILARTQPTVHDLAIALFSGLAGSYAIARPGIAGSLVGVAIAVALVPPLASCGIALTRLDFPEAGGAFLLFLTNAVTIVLGASVVFRFFDLDGPKNIKTPAWVVRTNLLLLIAIIALLAPLTHDMGRELSVGPTRPLLYPLSPAMRHNLERRIGDEPEVDILLMARAGVERGDVVRIVLVSPNDFPAQLLQDVEAIARANLPADAPVHIITLYKARSSSP